VQIIINKTMSTHVSRSAFRRTWLRRVWIVAILVMLALSSVHAADAMARALPDVQAGRAALAVPGLTGDSPAAVQMRAALANWNAAWLAEEGPIRTNHRATYAAVEAAMGDAAYYLAVETFDAAAGGAALDALVAAATPICGPGTVSGAPASPVSSPAVVVTYAVVLARAEAARTAWQAGDAVGAKSSLSAARAGWPDVEGRVATADGAAYQDIENLLARAAAQLKAGDAAAGATLSALVARMEPFAGGAAYTWFDPFLILLREGLEALLVVAALLVWLRPQSVADDAAQTGRARRWVWGGAVAGVALSLVLAVLVQALFQHLVTGTRRELVEGLVGLAAAVLLVWVAWWLHRQAALMAWSGYLRERIRTFATAGRRWALAGLAFLAVVREGAETALFMLGMAPSISAGDLALGIGAGAAVLVVMGAAVLGLGMKLPARPLFRVLSALLVLMAFKFTGAGVHALQVAGWCEASVVSWWPDCEWLALFPTIEAISAQGVLLLVFVALWWWTRLPQSGAGNKINPAIDPA
jgi:high-affinity iron transporter